MTVAKRGSDLTPSGTNRRADSEARKVAALPDMMSGMSLREVARKHGVSDSTVRRWAAEIRPELTDAKHAALEVLRSRGEQAAITVLEIMGDEEVDAKARLQAAFGVLDRIGVIKSEGRQHSGQVGVSIEQVIERLPFLARAKIAERRQSEEVGDDGDDDARDE